MRQLCLPDTNINEFGNKLIFDRIYSRADVRMYRIFPGKVSPVIPVNENFVKLALPKKKSGVMLLVHDARMRIYDEL